MKNTQEDLRVAVRRRCTPQKEVAKKIGCTDVYFNVWLKGHKDLGPDTLENIVKWLKE
jgi:hypothetical protein